MQVEFKKLKSMSERGCQQGLALYLYSDHDYMAWDQMREIEPKAMSFLLKVP